MKLASFPAERLVHNVREGADSPPHSVGYRRVELLNRVWVIPNSYHHIYKHPHHHHPIDSPAGGPANLKLIGG